MAAPPQWAQDLVIRVALDEGRDDVPELTWHRRKAKYQPRSPRLREWLSQRPDTQTRMDYQSASMAKNSSGRCFGATPALPARIHVTAGTDRTDAKLVLLHELAHWLSPAKEHHGPTFWDKAWELFRRYGIPIRYAKAREGNYRKGAIAAYARSRGGR